MWEILCQQMSRVLFQQIFMKKVIDKTDCYILHTVLLMIIYYW